MVNKHLLTLISLGVSTCVALAAIIYIIVDKTTYCRTGDAKPNTAVSEGGIVVCMPGFVFADGQTYHSITCDRPPTWNWGSVPACVPINEVVAWKCPVQTNEAELAGEISVFQPDPRSPVFIQGVLKGLQSSTIQVINVEDVHETCYITNEMGSTNSKEGMHIEGNQLIIDEVLSKPLSINETFQFFIRAIGSQHVQLERANEYDGTAIFFLEQNQETIGIFSASS